MEEKKNKKNQVQVIIDESGVEKSEAQKMLSHFTDLFKEAAKWEVKVKGIVITDASQVTEMQTARQARLALKDVRVKAEKVKKTLKAESLMRGRLIDGFYNAVVSVTKPLEDELFEKEKFVERQEAERKAVIKKEREDKLFPYCEDTQYFNLVDMTDAAFENLLTAQKFAYDEAQKAERKADEDRIKQEQIEAAEGEQQRLENIRLKAEADKIEKDRAKDRKAAEAREAKSMAARKKVEAETKKLRDDIEAKRVEAEWQEKVKAAKVKEETKRKAEAPDKELITDFINDMKSITYPAVKSGDAKLMLNISRNAINKALADLTAWINGG